MFGRNKPVVFDPYGSRRAKRRIPPWLWLLLAGVTLGAGGVIVAQERYLPPRLSADASARLKASFEQADAERARLKEELAATMTKLDATLAERQGLAGELAASKQVVDDLRRDVASLVASLPPDPRGGPVQVRAARFAVEGGMLAYDVVLSREKASGRALSGVMELAVAGRSGSGPETTVNLKPVAVSIGQHETVRGGLPLPDGFDPRQTTIKVLERTGGRQLGMRVINVK